MNADRLLALYDRVAEAPDAIDRLRRLVLDLAVRAKLVDQGPADEPASELLERIGAEKARLLGAKKIRKPRAVPPLAADDIPFVIPRSWAWAQIAQLGVISPRNEAPDERKASFVSMPMISPEFGVVPEHEPRPWAEIKRGYTHFAEGDVGLAKITPCFENGKSTVFRGLTGGLGAGTTELHVVRPLYVNPDYILLFLKSPHFIETGIPRMTGTAGQKRVPTEYFTSSPFPLPPLAEQQRIVAKVDELMALCDRLEAARADREEKRDRLTAASLARLDAPDPATFQRHATFALDDIELLTTRPDQINTLRQTIRNLGVRGSLENQDAADEPVAELLMQVEKPPRPGRYAKRSRELVPGQCGLSINKPDISVPTGWEWVPLVDVARLESGHTPSRNRPDWWGGDIPWMGLTDARAHDNGVIHDTAKHTNDAGIANSAARVLPAGTVCFSRTASVGYVVIMGEPMATSQDFVNWVPTEAITSEWLQLVMVAERPSIGRFSKGAVHQTIYYPAWLSMYVALPPLAEQRRIVARVHELMQLCDQLEGRLVASREFRSQLLDALLYEALSPVAGALEAAE